MKVSVFHTMRYGRIPNQPNTWPVPNALFEPEQGMRAMNNSLEDAQIEDELGFDWIACAEHHFSPFSLSSNVSVQAAALSQRVKRARIAILGALVPLGNPLRIAEEFAMIDNLTGGRLIAGLIRGAPYEYLVYNVNPAESRSRFEEGWELILKAWTERQTFGWEGRHFQYRCISIWPRPVQQPMPPVYVSGSSRDSGDFAARKRIGLGFAGATNIPSAARSAAFYREKAAEYGWQPTPEQVIYQIGCHVAETDEQAVRQARESWQHFFGSFAYLWVKHGMGDRYNNRSDFDQLLREGKLAVGSPATVREQLKRYVEAAGGNYVIGSFSWGNFSPEQILTSLELFAKEVMPAFQLTAA